MAEASQAPVRRSRFGRHVLPGTLWITAIWVGLWGEVSAANVLAGLTVGLLLNLAVPLPASVRRYRPSPVGLVRFALHFCAALLLATWDVAVKVLRPPQRLRPSTVRVGVGPRDPLVYAFAANATTLTPGTITLDVDPREGTMVIHVLDLAPDGEQQVRADLLRFVDLAEAALRPQTPARTHLDRGAL